MYKRMLSDSFFIPLLVVLCYQSTPSWWKVRGVNVQAAMWWCAGGYVVVAPEIILSTPGIGGTHPHPNSHSQSKLLDNKFPISKFHTFFLFLKSSLRMFKEQNIKSKISKRRSSPNKKEKKESGIKIQESLGKNSNKRCIVHILFLGGNEV